MRGGVVNQSARGAQATRSRLRFGGALGAAALTLLGAGCCSGPSETLKEYGPPDIVYELRGGVGRWYWYSSPPPPAPTEPTEVGFLWLDIDHQAVFTDDCLSYDGPIKSDDWRRFELARTREVGAVP